MEGSVEESVAMVHRDCSRRLKRLGILLIVIGVFHFLQIFMALLGILLRRMTAASTVPESSIITYISPVFSAWNGTLCLILGIGSIRARRWVRPLILIRSWYALVSTVLSIPLVLVVMKLVLSTPMKDQPQVPSTVVYAITITIMVIVLLITIGLSALFIWGYHSQDVRLTCEARNPSPSWTDRFPIPLLAWCLYMGFMSAYWFLFPLFSDVSWFGSYIVGMAGVASGWLMGVIYLIVLKQVAQRRMSGWIASAILHITLLASGTVTLLRSGLSGVLKHLHFSLPEQQLRPFLELGASSPWLLASGVALLGVAHLAYLLWIRRYFVTTPSLPFPPSFASDATAP